MDVNIHNIAPADDRPGGGSGGGYFRRKRKKRDEPGEPEDAQEHAPDERPPAEDGPRDEKRGEPAPDSAGRPVGVKVDIKA